MKGVKQSERALDKCRAEYHELKTRHELLKDDFRLAIDRLRQLEREVEQLNRRDG